MKGKVWCAALAASALLAGCSSSEYKIKGSVSDVSFEGKDVYLYDIAKRMVTDSTSVKDGAFMFQGTVDTVYFAHVVLDGRDGVDVIVEPGVVTVDMDESKNLGGTSENDFWRRIEEEYALLDEDLMREMAEIREAEVSVEEKERRMDEFYDRAYARLASFTVEEFKEYSDKLAGAKLVVDLSNVLSPEDIDSIAAIAGEKVKENELVQKIFKANEVLKQTAPGKMFVDFTVNTPTGKASLSDYVGKGQYTLVDFWASWCPPCRKEIPVIADVYRKYKKQGLVVLGVAVRDRVEDTEKAIEELKITWPQILNAGREPLELYGIKGIPHIILFAPDGTIVARDLRGDGLKAKVAEVMAKK